MHVRASVSVVWCPGGCASSEVLSHSLLVCVLLVFACARAAWRRCFVRCTVSYYVITKIVRPTCRRRAWASPSAPTQPAVTATSRAVQAAPVRARAAVRAMRMMQTTSDPSAARLQICCSARVSELLQPAVSAACISQLLSLYIFRTASHIALSSCIIFFRSLKCQKSDELYVKWLNIHMQFSCNE